MTALSLEPAALERPRPLPTDKLSLPLTIALAAVVLGEHVTPRVALGVGLMVVGGLLTL